MLHKKNHKRDVVQIQPDFIPQAASGPGGDSFRGPSFGSVLAARTTSSNGNLIAANTNLPASKTASTPMTSSGSASTTTEYKGKSPTPTPVTSAPVSANNGTSTGYSCPTHRLWRRFSILTLDAPSTAELRSVFAHACDDAFGGDGPVSSAMGGPRSDTMLFSGEVSRQRRWGTKYCFVMLSIITIMRKRYFGNFVLPNETSRARFSPKGGRSLGAIGSAGKYVQKSDNTVK